MVCLLASVRRTENIPPSSLHQQYGVGGGGHRAGQLPRATNVGGGDGSVAQGLYRICNWKCGNLFLKLLLKNNCGWGTVDGGGIQSKSLADVGRGNPHVAACYGWGTGGVWGVISKIIIYK